MRTIDLEYLSYRYIDMPTCDSGVMIWSTVRLRSDSVPLMVATSYRYIHHNNIGPQNIQTRIRKNQQQNTITPDVMT